MSKVLVVDDAAFMRITLKNILSKEGHEVQEAENGVAAISQTEMFQPDLITMDITMPEMDGLEAAERILKVNPKQKIIMCTALGQEAMVKKAILMGVRDFIVKPFQPDRVISAVRAVLAN